MMSICDIHIIINTCVYILKHTHFLSVVPEDRSYTQHKYGIFIILHIKTDIPNFLYVIII